MSDHDHPTKNQRSTSTKNSHQNEQIPPIPSAFGASSFTPKMLTPGGVLQLQRLIGNAATKRLISTKRATAKQAGKQSEISISTGNTPTIQRALGEKDTQALIEFAKKKLDVEELDATWTRTVKNLALFEKTLESAKISLSRTIQMKAGKDVYEKVEKKADNAPNSLESWLEEDESVMAALNPVGMNYTDKTTSAKTAYILWTTSIMGCLGVAAHSGGKAFLAHWNPTQLGSEELILQQIKAIQAAVGGQAELTLASPSLDATYINDFIRLVQKTAPRLQIRAKVQQGRLAVNAKTGQVMVDFKIEGLPKD